MRKVRPSDVEIDGFDFTFEEKTPRKRKIILLSTLVAASVLALSLGLGLGLSTVERVNFGSAAKEYFNNKASWNLSYKDDAKNATLINLPNKEKESQNSNLMYQMLVYGFSDGNGDGVGDFIGAKKRLSYLDDLGIGSIWLSPIHTSPSYHSYDVMDFTSVSNEFGGMEAFDSFLEEAHNRGIRVYLDMVFNHTSAKHPWFAEAVTNPNSKYRDYYTFGNSGQSARNAGYDSDDKFYAAFNWHGMPDLKLVNEEVVEELESVIEFWTKKGVDGFRYDAYKHFFDGGEVKTDKNGVTHSGPEIFAKLKSAAQKGAEEVGRTKGGEETDIQFMGEGLGIGFGEVLDYLNYETANDILPALDGAYDPGYWTSQFPSITQAVTNKINDRTKRLKEEVTKSSPDRTAPWIPYLDNHDSSRWFERVRFQKNALANLPDYVTTEDDKALLKSGLLTLSMMPGRPIIYQGDELAYDAVKRSDPWVREPLNWSDEEPIEFYDYDIYNNGELNASSDPIKLTESKWVGYADDRQNTSESIWQHVSNYLKIRANNSWLNEGSNMVYPLSLIKDTARDGGIRRKLDAQGNIEEEIVWIGSNIYSDYGNKNTLENKYNLTNYIGSRNIEVLYSSSSSSYNSTSNIASVSRNGVMVLKIKS